MKKLLLSLVALICVMNANAQTTADVSAYDNAIYVQGGVFPIGSEILLPIKTKNAIQAQAATFYVTLQEGLKFAQDPADETSIAGDAPYTDHLVMSNISTGMVALFSGKNVILPETFLLLHLDTEGMTPGEYSIKINNINISNADNATEVFVKDVDFVSTIVLTDGLVLDENAETLPVSSYSGEVTVKRTIKGNKWNTIVLPFSLSPDLAASAFGSDAQYADFSGFETDYGDDLSNLTPLGIIINFTAHALSVRNPLRGGTPYLIKTSKDIEEFKVTFSNETTFVNVSDVSKADSDGTPGKFTGSFVQTVVPADGLFIRDNKFYYSSGETNLKGFRGWFMLDAVLGQETDFGGVKMFIDGIPTDINDIHIANTNGAIFSIDGKKMNNDATKLQKGVYIIDGKKVAIK